MCKEFEDLTGMKFGRWTVVKIASPPETNHFKTKRRWLCQCSCSRKSMKEVPERCLRNEDSQSCGCLRAERAGAAMTRMKTAHGMTNTRLYGIYKHMLNRCRDKNNNRYEFYGGKGVRVCEEWQKFEPFMEWALSHGYRDDLSIDRIDVDGDYSPDNCRWATISEQANNKSSSRRYTYNGETHTIKEWADKLGFKYIKLWNRFDRGWSVERALTTP